MAEYIDYDSGSEAGMNPRHLAVAMLLIAVVGGLFVWGSLFLDKKQPDKLYDVNVESARTSAKVQVTPDLFKGKHQTPLPEDTPTWVPTPAPAEEPFKPKPVAPPPSETKAPSSKPS